MYFLFQLTFKHISNLYNERVENSALYRRDL